MTNQPLPSLIGHRGLPLLAPENTRASILSAVEHKIECIEIDVTMAGDGSLVIMHDPDLRLVGQADVKLVDLDRETLQKVDAGSWHSAKFKGEPLLFLEDLIALVKEHQLTLNLEIKINPDIETEKQVTAVFEMLVAKNMINTKLFVSSFNIPTLEQLRQLSGSIQLSALFKAIPDNLLNDVIHLHPVSIHCDQGLLSEQQARHIIPHYPLYCFTVNDTFTFTKLLAWGVSGVFCDRAYADDMKACLDQAWYPT